MIRFPKRGFTTIRMTLLATGLFAMSVSGTVNAENRVNHCSRWNGTPAIAWLASEPGRNAARNAAAILLNAGSHGLDPVDYGARQLAVQYETLTQGSHPTSDKQVREFNISLTRSVLCYLQNVGTGRLNPHAVHKGIWLPRQKFDQYQTLLKAFEEDDVRNLLLSAPPQSADYYRLRESLPQLHRMARTEGDLTLLRLAAGTSIKPGQTHPLVAAVRRRLIFLGDLAKPDAGRFEQVVSQAEFLQADPPMVEALIRFQKRHGLTPDGIVGKQVLATMRVPMIRRIAQTELGLERIRWYPRDHSSRTVRVNIPAYTMSAVAPDRTGNTDSLDSKVIVGQPGSRHTPLFAGPVTRIEFSPMWYVPKSIAKRSLLPILRRNPDYMKNRDLEFRLPDGKTSQTISAARLRRLASDRIRLQQRPGPNNALGKVKFVLPNHRAIFMHDTNKRQLFARDGRALSSGCVRVEKPLELAKLLLADHPKWNAALIDKAASATSTVVARTSKDTMVMLEYRTAVGTDEGPMRFMPDIYAMDKAAYRAVKRWSNPIAPVSPDMSLLSRLQAAGVAG